MNIKSVNNYIEYIQKINDIDNKNFEASTSNPSQVIINPDNNKLCNIFDINFNNLTLTNNVNETPISNIQDFLNFIINDIDNLAATTYKGKQGPQGEYGVQGEQGYDGHWVYEPSRPDPLEFKSISPLTNIKESGINIHYKPQDNNIKRYYNFTDNNVNNLIFVFDSYGHLLGIQNGYNFLKLSSITNPTLTIPKIYNNISYNNIGLNDTDINIPIYNKYLDYIFSTSNMWKNKYKLNIPIKYFNLFDNKISINTYIDINQEEFYNKIYINNYSQIQDIFNLKNLITSVEAYNEEDDGEPHNPKEVKDTCRIYIYKNAGGKVILEQIPIDEEYLLNYDFTNFTNISNGYSLGITYNNQKNNKSNKSNIITIKIQDENINKNEFINKSSFSLVLIDDNDSINLLKRSDDSYNNFIDANNEKLINEKNPLPQNREYFIKYENNNIDNNRKYYIYLKNNFVGWDNTNGWTYFNHEIQSIKFKKHKIKKIGLYDWQNNEQTTDIIISNKIDSADKYNQINSESEQLPTFGASLSPSYQIFYGTANNNFGFDWGGDVENNQTTDLNDGYAYIEKFEYSYKENNKYLFRFGIGQKSEDRSIKQYSLNENENKWEYAGGKPWFNIWNYNTSYIEVKTILISNITGSTDNEKINIKFNDGEDSKFKQAWVKYPNADLNSSFETQYQPSEILTDINSFKLLPIKPEELFITSITEV